MIGKMDDSTVQASVPVKMPGNRLRGLVYFIVAVTVVLTVATGFLVYERISEKIQSKDEYVAADRCLNGWQQFGSKCYLFKLRLRDDYVGSWYNCQRNGGYLPEVFSAAENAFLVNRSSMAEENIWIGGKRVAVQYEWLWINSWKQISSENAYTAWDNNEPTGDCLELNYSTGLWTARNCTGENINKGGMLVCEMKLE